MSPARYAPGALEIAQAWSWPVQVEPAAWIEENIVIPSKVTPKPGPFSFRGRPGFRLVANWFADPAVEQITQLTGSQQGKTVLICGISPQQASSSPGIVYHLRPSDDLCARLYEEKLGPIIRASPRLRPHLAHGRSPLQKDGIRFERGGNQMLASVASLGGLVDRTARVILIDELDQCEKAAGDVDILAMAYTRTRVWRGARKIFATSTPTEEERGIWKLWLSCQQWVWQIACPHCHAHQALEFSQVRFRENEEDPWPTADEVRDRRLAWYQCEACQGRIEEHQRLDLIEAGHPHCLTPERPRRHVGLHYCALYSPDMSLHDLAAKFLGVIDDPAGLTEFNNQELAVPKPKAERPVQIQDLTQRRSNYHQGDKGPLEAQVPAQVQAIVLGADIQKDHEFVHVLGMGWEGRASVVWAGRLDSLNDLRALGLHTWTTLDGRPLRPLGALLDSSDGNRTAELYRFCHTTHPWRPTKGRRDQEKPYLWRDVDYVEPGTRRTFVGLQRANLWETYYQDLIQTYLESPIGDGPGSLILPQDIPAVWYDHMRAMLRVRRSGAQGPAYYWKPIKPGIRIDLRDSLYLALAAADIAGWLHRRKPAPAPTEGTPKTFREVRRSDGLNR